MKKKSPVIFIGIGLFLLFVLVIVLSQLSRISQLTGNETSYTFPPEYSPDHLWAQADIISIDQFQGDLTLRMEFYPAEGLLNEDNLLAEDLLLDIDAASGNVEHLFKKDSRMNSQTVTLNLIGQPNDYPFDIYTAFLTMNLYAPKTENEKVYYEDVPLVVELFTDVPGYSVEVIEVAESEYASSDGNDDEEDAYAGFVDLVITVEHSKSVFAFIMFLTALQWVLALTAFLVTLAIIVERRDVTASNFGWLGALIFAQIALRNAMPDTPPVGTIGDTISFFWVLGIITISMLILVIAWIIRGE